MRIRRRPTICSIGSTDPTAAAGIGRDLVVYERLGATGVFAVAAVTAQNRWRVSKVSPVAPSVLSAQLDAIWREGQPDAIRIGLLPNAALMAAVARFLRSLRAPPPSVLDPVISASSGRRFLKTADLVALDALLPLVRLVTPNAREAAELTGARVRTLAEARQAAIALRARGCAVLVKSGHLTGRRVTDVLADERGIRNFEGARIRASMRGTGCTLAAAIAVALARGMSLRRAIARARAFVQRELKAQPRARAKGRA